MTKTDKIDVNKLFNPKYSEPKYVLIKALIKKRKKQQYNLIS